MNEFFMFCGKYIDNYACLIIGICMLTVIISALLGKVSKKQNLKKIERDRHCRELYNKYGDDKEKLTESIYKYYEECNYNPVTSFLSRFCIAALNVFMVIVVLASFNPISNMTDISKEQLRLITDVYSEEYENQYYTELSVLSELDNIEELLVSKGVSQETLSKLNNLQCQLTVGSIKTYCVPKLSHNDNFILLPIITFTLGFMNFIPDLLKALTAIKKKSISKSKAEIINCSFSLLVLIFSSIVIFYAPIIVCVYFFMQRVYQLCKKIFSCYKQKHKH